MRRSTAVAVVPVLISALLAGCAGGENPNGGSSAPASPSESPSESSVRVTGTVAEGLASPWAVAFLPDGTALVSERDSGRIQLLRPRTGAPAQVSEVGRIPGVRHTDGGEEGLLGLAVPPGDQVSEVFAYYTSNTDNRVVKLAWDGRRLGAPRPVLTGIPAARIHDGGRMTFGPDGFLYIGTGDAGEPQRAQNVPDLGGKILRVDRAGRPAADNPFPNSPVWSLGHRNVQGLGFDASGRLWASEFGANRHDELNLIERGQNYGWPIHEGRAGDRRFADPYAQWPTAEASPSGLAIVGDFAYLAALRGERLWQVQIQGDSRPDPTGLLVGDYGRLRSADTAPDGSVWVMTNNTDGRGSPRDGDDRILRLRVPVDPSAASGNPDRRGAGASAPGGSPHPAQ